MSRLTVGHALAFFFFFFFLLCVCVCVCVGLCVCLCLCRLQQFAWSLDISPRGTLVAVGTCDRLVKIVDYDQGTALMHCLTLSAYRDVKGTENTLGLI